MTSQFKQFTEQISNNEETNFMLLTDIHMEQKKWVSTIRFDNKGENETNTLHLQLPQCYSKSGIIEQSSKIYTDLMFDNSSELVKEMVDLFLSIESEAARQLHLRSGEWFSGDMEKMTRESFDDMFISSVRLLNRQSNVCLRVYIKTNNRGIKASSSGSNFKCDIYNKHGDTRSLSDIKADIQILPLVEVSEIRMTTTSFNLYVNMIECMIVDDMNVEAQPVRRINIKEQPSLSNDNITQVDDIHNEQDNNSSQTINKESAQDGIITNINDKQVVEDQETSENNNDDNGGDDNDNEVDDNIDIVNRNDDDGLMEISSLIIDETEPIKLKKPDEVYKEIYKAAITKAKRLRQVALEAYLDAKKIKAKFMLEDIYDSDDEGDENEDDAEMEEISRM